MQTSRASSTESNSVEFPHRMASIGAARSPANGDRAHGRHAGHHRADTMFRLGRSDLPARARVRTDSQIRWSPHEKVPSANSYRRSLHYP